MYCSLWDSSPSFFLSGDPENIWWSLRWAASDCQNFTPPVTASNPRDFWRKVVMKEINNTFCHFRLKSHCFLKKRIISYISVEAIAHNQTGVVSQSLIWNTALMLRSTEGECLFGRREKKLPSIDWIHTSWNYLDVAVRCRKSPRNTTAVSFHMLQEHLRLTLLSTMNLAFFLAIWQLIKVWFASHSLQSVHCVGSRTKSCVSSECLDVHFEHFIAVSTSLDNSRFHRRWVWVQEQEESVFLPCFRRFPLQLCHIERIA